MLSLILEFRDEAQFLLGFVISLSALRWGGGPERVIALVWLSLEFGDRAYHALFASGIRLDELDIGHAVLDGGACVALIAIALQANRNYPLWIAAFQIISASAHLAREMTTTISPIAYAVMVVAPSYFQLAIMLGGLLFHRHRTRKFGAYRAWRTSPPLPMSPATG